MCTDHKRICYWLTTKVWYLVMSSHTLYNQALFTISSSMESWSKCIHTNVLLPVFSSDLVDRESSPSFTAEFTLLICWGIPPLYYSNFADVDGIIHDILHSQLSQLFWTVAQISKSPFSETAWGVRVTFLQSGSCNVSSSCVSHY